MKKEISLAKKNFVVENLISIQESILNINTALEAIYVVIDGLRHKDDHEDSSESLSSTSDFIHEYKTVNAPEKKEKKSAKPKKRH